MKKDILTDFQSKVLEEIKKIPLGKITTYQRLAEKISHPKAFRAVGNALNKNPWAPEVPCHRVIKSNGKIGGYAFGKVKKKALLKKEGIEIKNNKIVDFESRII